LRVETVSWLANIENPVQPDAAQHCDQADIAAGELPTAQELIASITNKVVDRAKLPNRFAELCPAVRDYVATRCFGKPIDVDEDALRSHLARLEMQEGIAKYLARKIAELTIERRAMKFDRADFRLSETKPLSWRRNLPPLEAVKTVFNYVATYNDFERRFAEFLDRAKDVVRFASLGTTEQGESGTQFRVDYLKSSGAIGFYHPDWVVVQKTTTGGSTGSSRPRAECGKAPLPKTMPSIHGVHVSAMRPERRGITSGSTRRSSTAVSRLH
jgi:type III restriction enzyme